jgi:hypothetical protein
MTGVFDLEPDFSKESRNANDSANDVCPQIGYCEYQGGYK